MGVEREYMRVGPRRLGEAVGNRPALPDSSARIARPLYASTSGSFVCRTYSPHPPALLLSIRCVQLLPPAVVRHSPETVLLAAPAPVPRSDPIAGRPCGCCSPAPAPRRRRRRLVLTAIPQRDRVPRCRPSSAS
ncbi:hypothetical protein EXIGLDRAFT_216356 [Exidia glandulosa HHB12029]|uniref:Uncharacterized protein n=1 Tax=Exidia glandulosa HHB12029 TaxID=1314781 RepID=A0A165ZYL2_EXIGL|nr:hypothetical protein EXIGLDRAFT_216356 [Exidia glandulosa HHB12029]